MNQARPGGPTVLRMVLGRQLQELRERAGLSFEEAARKVTATHNTIRRMEKGEVGFNLTKVRALLGHYGVTDPQEAEAFVALAREANTPGWWHNYSDVLPPWFQVYVGLEEAASLIRGYEPQFVPGLLQTPDYARAVILADSPRASPTEVDRRVELRTARQRLLTREDPPRCWFILDETVLRRPAGTAEVMRAQITCLIEAAELPNVTLQVIPFGAGVHPAMYGMFHLFRFPLPEMPDLVYGESLTNAFYLDKPDDVAAYIEALDRMGAQAASSEETLTMLHDQRAGM